MICLPPEVDQGNLPGYLRWFHLSECVWLGPDWLTAKRPLHRAYGKLHYLFKTTLGVRDSKWTDYIDELANMEQNGIHNHEKTTKIYQQLLTDLHVTPTIIEEMRCVCSSNGDFVALLTIRVAPNSRSSH